MLFLLGFEAAIWHFRGATTCFYWASKLPSGTFPAAIQRRKTLPAALPWDLPRPLELFLLAFEAAIWPFTASTTFYRASKLPSGTFPAPLKSLKTLPAALPWHFPRPYELFLLGFEVAISPFRGATTFYWASKLPSGLFQQPFNALKLAKPLSSFAVRPREARCAVSVGLRSCYLAFPRRYNLFLLGFETAIWHVSSRPSTP